MFAKKGIHKSGLPFGLAALGAGTGNLKIGVKIFMCDHMVEGIMKRVEECGEEIKSRLSAIRDLEDVSITSENDHDIEVSAIFPYKGQTNTPEDIDQFDAQLDALLAAVIGDCKILVSVEEMVAKAAELFTEAEPEQTDSSVVRTKVSKEEMADAKILETFAVDTLVDDKEYKLVTFKPGVRALVIHTMNGAFLKELFQKDPPQNVSALIFPVTAESVDMAATIEKMYG